MGPGARSTLSSCWRRSGTVVSECCRRFRHCGHVAGAGWTHCRRRHRPRDERRCDVRVIRGCLGVVHRAREGRVGLRGVRHKSKGYVGGSRGSGTGCDGRSSVLGAASSLSGSHLTPNLISHRRLRSVHSPPLDVCLDVDSRLVRYPPRSTASMTRALVGASWVKSKLQSCALRPRHQDPPVLADSELLWRRFAVSKRTLCSCDEPRPS